MDTPFADYLYKFLKVSNLSVDKEEISRSLISHGIIKESDDSHYLPDFIAKDISKDLKTSRWIEIYTNEVLDRYDRFISDTIIVLINNAFYYLLLDRDIIFTDGSINKGSKEGKLINRISKYMPFYFNKQIK